MVCQEILANKNSLQTAAYLALLRAKGETAEDLLAMVSTLRAQSIAIELPHPCIDIVGTGGDGAQSVNISTGAAILTAACGVPVAKHGAHAVSSRCGSADVIEALGVAIDLPSLALLECLKQVNITFLLCPRFHPTFKSIAALRRDLGIPSIFNILGPLLHPAQVPFAMIGVGKKDLVPVMAEAMSQLNFKRALVFHGYGLDELTCIGPSQALLLSGSSIENIKIDPQALGFSLSKPEDLRGGLPQDNANILRRSLAGENNPVSDTLTLNAGMALWVFGAAASPQLACEHVRRVLREGQALTLLKRWSTLSQSLREKSLS